jgi:hypothetical protein
MQTAPPRHATLRQRARPPRLENWVTRTCESCGGEKSIAVAPIMPISGMGESGTALDQEHGPVAVMLDLMNPVSPFRRLVGEAR